MSFWLEKEDYEETACPFCKPKEKQSIPLRRVIEKLDSYLYSKDFDDARRHLEYWLKEADSVGDMRGKLSLLNECVGFYRKLGIEDKSLSNAEEAVTLAGSLDMQTSVTYGTALLNAATAYEAFGQSQKAVEYYAEAKEIYESRLSEKDERLGGLYNNMALALLSLREYEKSRELFEKAVSVMSQVNGAEPEVAVTYCNLADLVSSVKGAEQGKAEIKEYLDKAKAQLELCSVRDGNYAYVCEKCAPVFEYYGYEEFGKCLSERAVNFYEGH